MTRQHPQSAKAAEVAEVKLMIDGVEFVSGNVARVGDSIWFVSAGRWSPRYGDGVPHGEAFTLTEEQIGEWRAGEREGELQEATKGAHRGRGGYQL